MMHNGRSYHYKRSFTDTINYFKKVKYPVFLIDYFEVRKNTMKQKKNYETFISSPHGSKAGEELLSLRLRNPNNISLVLHCKTLIKITVSKIPARILVYKCILRKVIHMVISTGLKMSLRFKQEFNKISPANIQ